MWPFKKRKIKYKPQNRLEELFVTAALDPSARGDFMRQIFHFPLYVMCTANDGRLQLKVFRDDDGTETALAFTSIPAFSYYLNVIGHKPTTYIEISALALFQTASDNSKNLILNHLHDYSKFFTSSEVAKILSDNGGADTVNVSEGAAISLSQPAQGYPSQFIDTLANYTRRTPEVRGIYVGWIVFKDEVAKPSGEYFVAIDLETEDETIRNRVYSDLNFNMVGLLNGNTLILTNANGRDIKKYVDSPGLLKIGKPHLG
jgi:SseB protein C-terminal domain/SseB protein N-terminal domain